MQKQHNKEMKTFENPTIEILNFKGEDMIVTSGLSVENTGGGGLYNWEDVINKVG